MPPSDTPSGPSRRGRRRGASATRAAIVNAARVLFAEGGYDGTSMRAVARQAGVDAALVHHYFAGKAELFASVMEIPLDPQQVVATVLDGPREELGVRMVKIFLGNWDDPEMTPRMVALVRAAVTHEAAARVLREFLAAEVFGKVARAYRPPDDPRLDLRAAAAASQMVGMAMMRYVVVLPAMAEASPEDLASVLGPTLQTYLVDD